MTAVTKASLLSLTYLKVVKAFPQRVICSTPWDFYLEIWLRDHWLFSPCCGDELWRKNETPSVGECSACGAAFDLPTDDGVVAYGPEVGSALSALVHAHADPLTALLELQAVEAELAVMRSHYFES